MIKVLFTAFESLPFIKTGGLADVVYALPKTIDKEKYEVRIVLPLLKKIKDKHFERLTYLDRIKVKSGLIDEEANIYSCVNEGVEYLFIENANYFDREDVYGYEDDVQRFSFFCCAVIEMMIKMNYYPDIIHEHDYHTAVISALCKLRFAGIEEIKRIKHIFTIHNLVYQGMYDKQVLFDYLALDYLDYANGSLRFNDCANFMKIGIIFADKVTTVSKTYAKEICTPQYGEGLDSILKYRQDDLSGIVNGIDIESFNPKTDAIAKNYDVDSLDQKTLNKLALQRELGLKEDPDVLLVGLISRLTFQKGLDLIAGSLEQLLKKNVQIAILGSGESRYEYAFRLMEKENKGKAVFYCGYNEGLSHRMYAGLDVLLMPSLFEPCGISQLIAMRYGTIPYVRETGGLKDTVEPFNEYTGEGRGFSFGPYSQDDFLKVFDYLYLQYFEYPERFREIQKNAMKYDVSFVKSAKEYESLYEKVVNNV